MTGCLRRIENYISLRLTKDLVVLISIIRLIKSCIQVSGFRMPTVFEYQTSLVLRFQIPTVFANSLDWKYTKSHKPVPGFRMVVPFKDQTLKYWFWRMCRLSDCYCILISICLSYVCLYVCDASFNVWIIAV